MCMHFTTVSAAHSMPFPFRKTGQSGCVRENPGVRLDVQTRAQAAALDLVIRLKGCRGLVCVCTKWRFLKNVSVANLTNNYTEFRDISVKCPRDVSKEPPWCKRLQAGDEGPSGPGAWLLVALAQLRPPPASADASV